MHEIVVEVERTGSFFYDINLDVETLDPAESIAVSASLCALKLNAAAIICLTTTGRTASLISKYRPKAPIIACTKVAETLNRLELIWGIQTFQVASHKSSEDAMAYIEQMLVQYGFAKAGDKVIMTLGMPVSQGAKTNTLRVFTVSDAAEKSTNRSNLPVRFQ
jgi:pyruvate kinase